MTKTSVLPFLPISASMLMEMPFFMSSDPRVVRAGFWMLDAAWRSQKPGSIQSGFPSLSAVTRLTEAEVAENYETLTHGWLLEEDGRLHHLQLECLAESLVERFGDQLAVLTDSAAFVCQGGTSDFELVPPGEVVKKKRGKHKLPKDFQMDKATGIRALAEGYVCDEHSVWLNENFKDYATASAILQVDWQAACRKYLSSKYTRDSFKSKFGYFPGQMPKSDLIFDSMGVSAKDRLRRSVNRMSSTPTATTFKQRTASHNSDAMSEAMIRRIDLSEQRSQDASSRSYDFAGPSYE